MMQRYRPKAKERRRMERDRRRQALNACRPVFIPGDRMRRIRWEESVMRSIARRDGVEDPAVVHITCHCGSVDCVGIPIPDPMPRGRR